MRENDQVTASKPAIPNVLANRYASLAMATIWSPQHKVVLERQLWIAVLKAQRDLGIDVPDGVVQAYAGLMVVGLVVATRLKESDLLTSQKEV